MSAIGITRAILYIILFACAAVLLGLTAYHVHFTETMFIGAGFYVPIVVELLVTSCLAIIISVWFFIAIIFRIGNRQHSRIAEALLLFIIWIMFLVGASIFSRGWHNVTWCLGSRHACRILNAIIAFSWISWVFTSILLVVCCADLASDDHSDAGHRSGRPGQTTQTANTPVTTAV